MSNESKAENGGSGFWVCPAEEIRSRFMHTMIRVKDLEESLRFYVDVLGMKVLDRFDVEARRATALFVGFGGYRDSAVLEIAQKWDQHEPYTHGTGYGHIALGVPDLPATIERIEKGGFEVVEKPKVIMADGPLVAFVRDADGFVVELIQLQPADVDR